ncbi:hypothetical protein COO60DRAFT_906730 [Scenedesmus sp. NREL 46B-D3]|nr:hypothetical protein COO60DRAFT_906730 [Scenedesmus sp. NREL 46B-D3]
MLGQAVTGFALLIFCTQSCGSSRQDPHRCQVLQCSVYNGSTVGKAAELIRHAAACCAHIPAGKLHLPLLLLLCCVAAQGKPASHNNTSVTSVKRLHAVQLLLVMKLSLCPLCLHIIRVLPASSKQYQLLLLTTAATHPVKASAAARTICITFPFGLWADCGCCSCRDERTSCGGHAVVS